MLSPSDALVGRTPRLTSWVEDGVETCVFTLDNPVNAPLAHEDPPASRDRGSRWPSMPSLDDGRAPLNPVTGHMLPSLQAVMQRHAARSERSSEQPRRTSTAPAEDDEDAVSTTQLEDEEGNASPENAQACSGNDTGGGGSVDPSNVMMPPPHTSPDSQAELNSGSGVSGSSDGSGGGGDAGPETTQDKVWAVMRHLPQLSMQDIKYSPHVREFNAQSVDWEGMLLQSDGTVACEMQKPGKLLHMSSGTSAPISMSSATIGRVRHELDVGLRERYSPVEGLGGGHAHAHVSLPVPCKLPHLSKHALAVLVNMHDNAVAPSTTAMLREATASLGAPVAEDKPKPAVQGQGGAQQPAEAARGTGAVSSDTKPQGGGAVRARALSGSAQVPACKGARQHARGFRWADGQQRFFASLPAIIPQWVQEQPAAAASLRSSIMLKVTQLSVHPLVYVAYDHAQEQPPGANEAPAEKLTENSSPEQAPATDGNFHSEEGGASGLNFLSSSGSKTSSGSSGGGNKPGASREATATRTDGRLPHNLGSGGAGLRTTSNSSDEDADMSGAPSSHTGSSDNQTDTYGSGTGSNTALATSSASGSDKALGSSDASKPDGSAASGSSLASKVPRRTNTADGRRVAASNMFMQLFGLNDATCCEDHPRPLQNFLEKAQVNPKVAYERTRNYSSTGGSSGSSGASGSSGSSSSDGGADETLVVQHHPPLSCMSGSTVVPRLKAISLSVACSASIFVFRGCYMHPAPSAAAASAPQGSTRKPLALTRPKARQAEGDSPSESKATGDASQVGPSSRGSAGGGSDDSGHIKAAGHARPDPSLVASSTESPQDDSDSTGGSNASTEKAKPSSDTSSAEREHTGRPVPASRQQVYSSQQWPQTTAPTQGQPDAALSATSSGREMFEAFAATEVVSLHWATWRSTPSLDGMGLVFVGYPMPPPQGKS